MKIKISIVFLSFIMLFVLQNKVAFAQSGDHYKLLLLSEKTKKNSVTKIIQSLKEEHAEDITYVPEIQMISYKESSTDASSVQTNKALAKYDEIEELGGSAKFSLNDDTTSSAMTEPLNTPAPFDTLTWNISSLTENYESYKLTKGQKEVKVALVDSGLDYNHPELKNSIDTVEGKSYVADDSNLLDQNGHGTEVAGIIAANGQMRGLVPNITLVPYKVIGKQNGESIWMIQAIVDAANNHSDVINLSLGTYKAINIKDEKVIIRAYERALKYAERKQSIVVASAGNESISLDKPVPDGDDGTIKEIHLPGGLHNVLTISGIDRDGNIANYSNYGKEVDFSAPGGSFGPVIDNKQNFDFSYLILTTYPAYLEPSWLDASLNTPKGYAVNLGTSLAAPHASGTVAAVISRYLELHQSKPSIDKTMKYLKVGAIDAGQKGRDELYGYGIINSFQSLNSIK